MAKVLCKYWGEGWHEGEKFGNNVRTLLLYQNGACGAWSKFFLDTVQVQGIKGAEEIGIFNRDNAPLVKVEKQGVGRIVISNGGNPGLGLLVKNVFVKGRPPIPPQRYDPYPFQFQGSIPTQGDGGKPSTRQAFPNHAIAKFAGRYYDPSYGVSFDNPEAWEQAALEAVFWQYQDKRTGQEQVDLKLKRPGVRLTWFTDEPKPYQ